MWLLTSAFCAFLRLGFEDPEEVVIRREQQNCAGDDSADPVALAQAAYAITGNRAIYVGFDWRALLHVQECGGACWFTVDKLQGDARSVIDMIAQAGGQGWFPNFPDAMPENVAYARQRGLKVGAWTVNDPADLRRLTDLDAICTDRPDLLAECL